MGISVDPVNWVAQIPRFVLHSSRKETIGIWVNYAVTPFRYMLLDVRVYYIYVFYFIYLRQ